MTQMTSRTALVLGATGGIGGAVARRLLARGWRVKALARDPARAGATNLPGIDWRIGDAMRPGDVSDAARGTSLLVHAVNPPGYRDWDRLVLPMLDNAIAAARSNGARLLLPGTLYNYGSDAPEVIDERTPQIPTSRKGVIRAEMERRLQESGVKAIIVRAGDFFGPGASGNSWFRHLVKPGKPVRAVTYPGARGVGHAWAYLPDLAEAMVAIAEREPALARYETFQFAGHHLASGEELARCISRLTGETIPVRPFPWVAVRLLAPAAPLFRELLDVAYLWRRDMRLDNIRLVQLLGEEPHTPLDAAITATLEALGCRSSAGSSQAEPALEARAV